MELTHTIQMGDIICVMNSGRSQPALSMTTYAALVNRLAMVMMQNTYSTSRARSDPRCARIRTPPEPAGMGGCFSLPGSREAIPVHFSTAL